MDNISDELSGMLCDNLPLMKKFNKDSYADAFKAYFESYRPLLERIDEGYASSDDKDKYIGEIADRFVNIIKDKENSLAKKSEKEHFAIDHNSILTLYLLPALLEIKTASCKALAGEILKRWNEIFTRYSLSMGTFEEIDAGFKRKLCYITTAVCESLGKPDDCYELKTLRGYRDGYLLGSDEGKTVVDTYYNIAPTIVNRINRRNDSAVVYRKLFDKYISPCIDMIEHNRLEECRELYSEMVYSLKDQYITNKQ